MTTPVRTRLLVIACGALARELGEVVAAAGLDGVAVECLPARLHNRPELIPEAVRERIRRARPRFDRILVGYADCGTGGRLDQVCRDEDVERLPGAHCYELFAGRDRFASLHDAEPGTFYLTDYMVRNFDRLIIDGLGIGRHPELLELYFGNYERVVHLAQHDDDELAHAAERAADRLGLRHERILTGFGELGESIVQVSRPDPAPAVATS